LTWPHCGLPSVLAETSDALLLYDPATDRVLDVNSTVSELLGLPRETLLTKPFNSLWDRQAEALTHFFQRLSNQSTDLIKLDFTRLGQRLNIEIQASPVQANDQPVFLLRLRDSEANEAMHQALQAIVEGTASGTGEVFFRTLVRELARALGVRIAFVAEFTGGDRNRVRTLAFWQDNDWLDNFEFDLSGTPCEVVACGKTVYYTQKVYEMFPNNPYLREMGIESYFGVPLIAEAGGQFGHLAVENDRPLEREFRGMSLLKIFAARAMAELERNRVEQALRASEARLAGIMTSVLDAIITIDAERRIQLFNPAAERMFRTQAATVLNQPLGNLLSARFNHLLTGYCLAGKPTVVTSEQLWAPEGLAACRTDGEEFPVEVTLSPLTLGTQRLYTLILRDLTERQRAEAELRRLQEDYVTLHETVRAQRRYQRVIGESEVMRRVFTHIEQVADTDTTVLLTGETGTGKEVIAQTIHDLSPRRERLLVQLNCAALPSELVESELFGHEKGAFTGAIQTRKGRFEIADGGTLFLDEVGELSPSAQAKLLRVLQEREFERVGGGRPIKVNVRVIAATNRDLAAMVRAGSFREDLYYRFNVFPVRLPPLRERGEDILLLARHFLDIFAHKIGRPVRDLAPHAPKRLLRYRWPGNVRELQNVIERAVILAHGEWLDVDEALDLRLQDTSTEPVATLVRSPNNPLEVVAGDLTSTLEAIERNSILKALEDCKWIIEGPTGAAAALGLKPSTLRSRIQKLAIRRSE
jgi:formate hydrogenlyase transcriptional activator